MAKGTGNKVMFEKPRESTLNNVMHVPVEKNASSLWKCEYMMSAIVFCQENMRPKEKFFRTAHCQSYHT